MSGGIPTFETMTSRRRRDVPVGHTIQAQPIKDSSYMESMVNFFQDISQVYTNTTQTEEKEVILWARIFDYKDVLDPDSEDYLAAGKTDPLDTLLIVLGYKNGIQVWNICDNGDVQEMLSLRQGPVKTVCLVPPPNNTCDLTRDEYTLHRPLLAMCLAADKKQLFTSVSIISLRTKEQVSLLKFDEDVEQIRPGPGGLLIVTLQGQLQAFDTFNFERVFIIGDCYPSPSIDSNPIAVGRKWLAYAPSKQVSSYQSAGGVEDDGIHSYAATVLNAAKTIKKGLVSLGDTVNWLAKTSLTGGEEHSAGSAREVVGQRSRNASGGSGTLPEHPDGVPGLVTIVNISMLCKHCKDESPPTTPEQIPMNGMIPVDAIVAHFPAHSQAVVCMEFSPSGALLATADRRGHAFHVFSILPHPSSSKMGAVHHIYTLFRGDTSARVQGISFSKDCRWLTVNTLRGTSHIFPIASYGGAASVRTHLSHRVVNRSSRFHKSAGLEDMDPSMINVGQSSHSVADNGSPVAQAQSRRARTYSHGSRIHNSTNPRLPPHPQPTIVHALVQIGSSRTPHVLTLPGMTGQSPHGAKMDKATSAGWQTDIVVASVFTRGQLKASRSVSNHDVTIRRVQLSASSNGGQTLIIISSNGYMTEHHLEPRPQQGITKVSDDSPIELVSAPRYQWFLQRLLSWSEVNLPLPPHNSLLEVDNRRRTRINAQLDVTSSITSSVSSGSGVSTTVHAGNPDANASETLKSENVHYANSEEHDWTSIPKTHQPTSRNSRFNSQQINRLPRATSKTNHSLYPGTAMPHLNKQKKALSSDSPIIPMGHHVDDELIEKPDISTLKEQTASERMNGQMHPAEHHHLEHERRPSSADSILSHGNLGSEYDEWLSQVEMVSHEGPARRLWMGPQFCFKIKLSTGSTTQLSSASSALISNRSSTPVPGTSGSPPRNDDVYVDEMDLNSLKIEPSRSDPMPTPKSGDLPFDRFEPLSVTIEAGSGSFDLQAHMLEIGAYGSLEDRRFASIDNEDRLRERIADAMQEQYNMDFGSGNGAMTRDIRSKSDSSDIVEFVASENDVLLSVGGFDFDT